MTNSPLARRTFLLGTAGAVTAVGLAIASAGAAGAIDQNYQSYWAWCSLCSEVFYAGPSFRGQGNCPAQQGYGHANPQGVSYNYSMAYNANGDPGFQVGWRWCQYCYALYWPGTDPPGCCPAGKGSNSNHSPGASYNYAVPVGLAGGSYQPGWCYCNACGCYYHSNSGWGTQAGLCWVNDNTIGSGTSEHTPGSSWHYQLLH